MDDIEPTLIPLENHQKIYIGTSVHATSISLLYRLGIKHIINTTTTKYHSNETAFGLFEVLHLNVKDHPKSDIKQHFGVANKFIEEALFDRSPVLVHCEGI